MSVCQGSEFLGRATRRGPVLYCASPDEATVARSELVRMGWATNPLFFLDLGSLSIVPKDLLDRIAHTARQVGVVLIVFDMLFDFINIRDARNPGDVDRATAAIHDLVGQTRAAVVGTHHCGDIHLSADFELDVAKIPGSIRFASRFSPLLVCKKWAPDLFTVESTQPSDQRGEPLRAVRVVISQDGRAVPAGAFRASRVHAGAVVDYLRAMETHEKHSSDSISAALQINVSIVRLTLREFHKEGRIQCEKKGKSDRYWIGDR